MAANPIVLPVQPEPYVNADQVAEFLSTRRQEVLKLTRQGVITGYPISGTQRHIYKYKLSEVDRDMAKLRQPSTISHGSPSRSSAERKQ
jgi:hypothetical protein